MDHIDEKILSLLKQNSRMTSSQISGLVHLSIPAVSERIRKLEETGYIRKFTLQMNREKLAINLLAFIFVRLENSGRSEEFKSEILRQESILECHHIAGEYDYLLKVAVKNTRELETLVSETLKKEAGVVTNTMVVLSTVKEES